MTQNQTEMDSFSYISYGIVLPIIILFGLPGNCFALYILNHRFLRNSPVSLLKVLAIHGILTMCFSIYAEVFPTLKMYFKPNSSGTEFSLNGDATGNESESIFVELTRFQRNHTKRLNIQGMYREDRIGMNKSDISINVSSNGLYTSIAHDEEKEATLMITTAISNFISYSLIHLGLLVSLLLTTERCIAVIFPLKARHWLTSTKTRIITAVLFLLCVIIHLPQLTKEITFAKSATKENHDSLFHNKSVINPIRRDYQDFVAYLSLFLCVAIFILNMTLLIKLYLIKRKLRNCRHLQNADRKEINVSVAIVVLVFFQLPFHISSAFINEISYKFLSDNIKLIREMAILSRLLYITHSSLNFVIYCLMAKNCRYVLRLIFKRVSTPSVSLLSQRRDLSTYGSFLRRQMENIPLKENGILE